MDIKVLGIDLAKDVFHLHGLDEKGQVVVERKLSRRKLLVFMKHLQPCEVFMEVGPGCHYWAREFQQWGHRVKLIAAQFVKPYVKTNKHDKADAAAIVEAGTRPHMRFVVPKSVDQQDLQNLHRIRDRLVGQRTALSNQIRGILAEYGIVFSKGIRQLQSQLPQLFEQQNHPDFSVMLREQMELLWQEFQSLQARIQLYEEKLRQIFQNHPECQRLATIPGVGPLIATAAVASLRPQDFKNGRGLSAFLGLVPKQHSSGGKQKNLGISKRGNTDLRRLLIHGARSVVRTAARKKDPRSQWMERLRVKIGMNKTAVAVANKNARLVWAVLNTQQNYHPSTENKKLEGI